MEKSEKGISGATNFRVRVLYADTDKMGVVYHATYLRWFEAGRAKYMRQRGISYSTVEDSGVLLPVVEAHATYHKPARYDDVLSISTWAEDVGRLQIKFGYEINLNGETLVRGFTRHASTNEEGKLVRLPEKIRLALASHETEAGVEVDC